MVTPQDISVGLITVGKAIDTLKKATELADKTSNVEIKEIIVKLRSQLVDQKNLLIDAKDEIATLKNENIELKAEIEKLNSSKKPILKNDAYWIEGDDTPFCMNCYDASGKLIHLSKKAKVFSAFGNMECATCNSNFTIE